MGFFSGRVSFLRFRVKGPAPKLFGETSTRWLEMAAVIVMGAGGRGLFL